MIDCVINMLCDRLRDMLCDRLCVCEVQNHVQGQLTPTMSLELFEH